MHAGRRALAAAPDAVTAWMFYLAWAEPLRWGHGLVKTMVTVILVEFLVVHSAGFLGLTLLDDSISRRRKTAVLLGLSAFYMMFVLGFAFSMREWWPVAMFGWLLGSKFVSVWFDPRTHAEDAVRLKSQWVLGAMFYMASIFGGILLPVPLLGLTPETVAQLGLPGGGEWISRPHTAVSAGVIYFSLLALMKLGDWKLPAHQLA